METLPKFIIFGTVKQSGNIWFTGTFPLDDLTLYRMNGEFYARKKSRLTGKRFRNDDAFKGSRRSAARFKRGNELASQVYGSLPKEERFYKLFCRLKREAILWLKQGKTEEEVVSELEAICANPEAPTCHLNLSLTLTVSPVPYYEWYRHEEKVYQYNYENEEAIERRQAVAFIEGSEDVALSLSGEDIWALREGREEDVLNVVKKMEERLGRKQKRARKNCVAPAAMENKLVIASRPIGRRIVKPIVLRPRWNKTVYGRVISATRKYYRGKQEVRPAPA